MKKTLLDIATYFTTLLTSDIVDRDIVIRNILIHC